MMEEIPEKIKKMAAEILKNENFSEEDGDEIIITQKDNNIFFAYIKSKKRGSFGQVAIRGDNLTFLYGASGENPERLIELLKSGAKSIPASSQSDKARSDVRLPVIKDDDKLMIFAKKLTDAFMSFIEREVSYEHGPLTGKWYSMIYNALVLLLSQREEGERLFSLPQIYTNPKLVRVYLKRVTNRETYEYFRIEVPRFMQNADMGDGTNYFNIRVASLIGEQEIQDLCRNYKEEDLRL